MRAVQIRAFGEPGLVLELADLPEPPAPAAGEVLIGVEHAPIDMNDLYLIQGVYPVRPSLPSVVGNERRFSNSSPDSGDQACGAATSRSMSSRGFSAGSGS